jgi:hypothetical protein
LTRDGRQTYTAEVENHAHLCYFALPFADPAQRLAAEEIK